MTQKLGYPKFDLVSDFLWGLGVVGKKSPAAVQRRFAREGKVRQIKGIIGTYNLCPEVHHVWQTEKDVEVSCKTR